jgi:cobalt transporter subunit CbtB
MQIGTAATAQAGIKASSSTKQEALTGAAMAAVLGLVLLWGVGFSHIDVLHNAAHDTRHSNAFPCH